MKKSSIVIGFIAALLLTAGGLAIILANHAYVVIPADKAETQTAIDLLTRSLASPRVTYVDFLHTYRDASKGTTVLEAEANRADTPTLALYDNVSYTVWVPEAGLYQLNARCELLDNTYINPILNVTINGDMPYQEANTIVVPLQWADSTKDFPLDSFGDESLPTLNSLLNGSFTFDFYGSAYTSDTPLLFYFQQGQNEVAVKNLSSTRLTISGLSLYPPETLYGYDTYIAQYQGVPKGVYIEEEAEHYSSKNNTLVQLFAEGNPSVKPTSLIDKRLNSVDVGMQPGQEITLDIQVPQDGLYHIAIHGRAGNDDFPVFYTLRIDGDIPFTECLSYAVPSESGSNWYNVVLGGDEAYWFYLTKGTHALSLRAENAPVAEALRNLQLIVDHINYFNLEILKITGSEIDKNRTWQFTRYIPETAAYLEAYDTLLRGIVTDLAGYSPKGSESAQISDITQALALLDTVRKEPNDLPLNLDALSGTSNSVLQLAGDQLDQLTGMYLGIDAVYLYAEEELPPGGATFLQSMNAGLQQLIASYTAPKYTVKNKPEDLNIWVKSTLMEMDLIKKLTDVRFAKPGMPKINLSVMPDESTLVLAAAAGNYPDIALTVPSHVPFNLSVRDALYDLTSFPDFWEVAGRMPMGAILPYVFNERVYALPQTVNFNALAYREDIFRSLGLEPPDTWEDIFNMMPTLQRYGMSFYHPIATNDAYKWYYQTTPLILQNGGHLFNEDGLSSAINEPGGVRGLTMLTDLFTTYALEAQVPVFSSSFRNGSIPVGIIDRYEYLTFKNAAPEIAGQWKMSLYPGTRQEDGSIARWFVNSAECLFIFNGTKKAELAWEFVKWWTDTPTQIEYGVNVRSTMGPGMLVLSSNLEALAQAPIDEEDRQLIMESFNWLTTIPGTPGDYIVERSISDIWNDVVFKNVPVRVAIDKRMMAIQRELRRKMVEFGYVDATGEPLKPYAVRDMDWLLAQLAANGGDRP